MGQLALIGALYIKETASREISRPHSNEKEEPGFKEPDSEPCAQAAKLDFLGGNAPGQEPHFPAFCTWTALVAARPPW